MKLCDRCPEAGRCLLDYLGESCRKNRLENCPEVVPNTAELLCDAGIDRMADMLAAYAAKNGAGHLKAMSRKALEEWLRAEDAPER